MEASTEIEVTKRSGRPRVSVSVWVDSLPDDGKQGRRQTPLNNQISRAAKGKLVMNVPSNSDVVGRFIARYRREFDFFEQAGRIVAQQLEAQLDASGIRAMVTPRMSR